MGHMTPATDTFAPLDDHAVTAPGASRPRIPVDSLPPAPPWWAAWLEEDDRRRAQTMAAGKARLALRHNRPTEAHP